MPSLLSGGPRSYRRVQTASTNNRNQTAELEGAVPSSELDRLYDAAMTSDGVEGRLRHDDAEDNHSEHDGNVGAVAGPSGADDQHTGSPADEEMQSQSNRSIDYNSSYSDTHAVGGPTMRVPPGAPPSPPVDDPPQSPNHERPSSPHSSTSGLLPVELNEEARMPVIALVDQPPGPATASSLAAEIAALLEDDDLEELEEPLNELELLLEAQGELTEKEKKWASRVGRQSECMPLASLNTSVYTTRLIGILHNLLDDEVVCNSLKGYKFQIESNLGANNFQKLRFTWPQLHLPSLKSLRLHLQRLTGLKIRYYHMCINCCICYAGKYADEVKCPFCKWTRYLPNSATPRRQFEYIPLIPQIQALYANPKTAKEMRWRSEHHLDDKDAVDGQLTDIYGGRLYQGLLNKFVTVNGQQLGFKYFSNPQDVLLVALTDGFRLFKRGGHSAWPILFVNANIDPKLRYHLNNTICTGSIPGNPEDFDSFLSPTIGELEQAAYGVPTFDAHKANIDSSAPNADKPNVNDIVDVRVFAPFGGGDIPAAAKAWTGGKQHSAKHACRGCTIEGIRPPGSKGPVYYAPVVRPPDCQPHAVPYDIGHPPMRTHSEYLRQAKLVDTAPTRKERETRSVKYGINGTPLTARIPGIQFPYSYCPDLMHLIENQGNHYIELLTGNFKGLDEGSESYELPEAVWKEIGLVTVGARGTIPSQFGRLIPNIATEYSFFTAEAQLVWWTLYAPILLRGRLEDKYYWHLRRFVNIVNICIQNKTTSEDRATLRKEILTWYEEWERCVLTFGLSDNVDKLATAGSSTNISLTVSQHAS